MKNERAWVWKAEKHTDQKYKTVDEALQNTSENK